MIGYVMQISITRATIGVMLFTIPLHSQSDASPQFDVATVKSSPPPTTDLININLGTLRDGRLTFTNASLSDCLKYAYDIVSNDQIVGPDWIKSKAVRFDIVAVSQDTTLTQVKAMLRSLLADRLKVTLHHDSRNLSYLALVIAKNGPKIHHAQVESGFSVPQSTAM